MPEILKSVVQDARNRPLPYIVQVFALLAILANLWLGSKLYPLARNIDEVASRVSAIEQRNIKIDPLVSEFIEQKGDIKAIHGDLVEIKQDLRDIKNFLNIR